MKEYEILIETINPCGGEAHAKREIIEAKAESPEAYVKAKTRYPVIDHVQEPDGDTRIVTGDGAGSMVKGGVQLPQPKSNILVYGGFGNTEVLRRHADGCLGFDDVHSQFTGSFFHLRCHVLTSDAVCCFSLFGEPDGYDCGRATPDDAANLVPIHGLGQ